MKVKGRSIKLSTISWITQKLAATIYYYHTATVSTTPVIIQYT